MAFSGRFAPYADRRRALTTCGRDHRRSGHDSTPPSSRVRGLFATPPMARRRAEAAIDAAATVRLIRGRECTLLATHVSNPDRNVRSVRFGSRRRRIAVLEPTARSSDPRYRERRRQATEPTKSTLGSRVLRGSGLRTSRAPPRRVRSFAKRAHLVLGRSGPSRNELISFSEGPDLRESRSSRSRKVRTFEN